MNASPAAKKVNAIVRKVADRQRALQRIGVSDIFHAGAPMERAPSVGHAVTDAAIQARNMATQIVYDFDSRTGVADWYVFSEHYTDGPWKYALTDVERRGLIFVSYFYPAFPM